MRENHYSIKDLENLTHIKAHTIRIWEQRYDILQPHRTATNIRYYTDNDLRKILNVNLLYTNGIKISKIAALEEQEILDKVNQILGESSKIDASIQDLINVTMQLDHIGLNKLLNSKFDELGINRFYVDVLIPTFIRIGELWQLNSLSIGHEHFFTNIVRNFLILKTQQIQPKVAKDKSVILFLHASEEHEISLLIYHYILLENGYKCFYLGQNMPLTDFEIVYKQIEPDYVLTNFVKYITDDQFKDILDNIYQITPANKLVIGGAQAIASKKMIHKSSHLIQSEEDLKLFYV